MPSIKKKILVADDNYIIRRLLKSLLESKGYDVALATDGVEALAAAQADKPDMVVLDVRMPSMTGIEVLRHLRASGNDVPVMILTAFADKSTAREAREAGAFDFVAKPFNLINLTGIIRRKLQT